jgi:mono/diheme cytochrome c family protein
MERSIFRRGALVVVLAAASCVATVDGRTGARGLRSELSISGREEFLRACASCHGTDARGGGTVAAALRTPPPDLTLLAARGGGAFPRARVVDVITGALPVTAHGSREMPVWSERFAPADYAATAAASIYARRWVEALVAYLGSIQRSEPGAA